MKPNLLPAIVLAGLCGTATAQFASFTPFGSGCTVTGLTMPTIGAVGLPQIGATFTITYSGPNRATWPTELHPLFMYGFQSISLPLDAWFTSQPIGCTIYLVPRAFVLMGPGTGIGYASSVTFQIPTNYSLVGVSFLAQWGVLNQTCLVNGCNVNALLTSDAATVTMGI